MGIYDVVFLLFFALVMAFTFVTLFGAPYLPTLKPQIDEALKLSGIKQGQTLLELGSGDGRVLFAAAEQGIRAVGYELNPLLVVYSKIRALKYKGLVEVHWGNFWAKKWPKSDVVFVFLLDRYMKKLDKHIVQQYSGKKVKLVSFAFEIPGKKAVKESKGLYLYHY